MPGNYFVDCAATVQDEARRSTQAESKQDSDMGVGRVALCQRCNHAQVQGLIETQKILIATARFRA